VTAFFPAAPDLAAAAALELAKRLNLQDPEVLQVRTMHPAEGTLVEVKGVVGFDIDPRQIVIPEKRQLLSAEQIRSQVERQSLRIVAATVGEDEHSVGMREIIDIKHGGLESFGIDCHYLGTSVSIEKVVDAALEVDADAILISTIISHADIHRRNMRRLHDLCLERGVRERFLLVAGGTQVSDELARSCGMDAGFGRGTKGIEVADFLVRARQQGNRHAH
jgi:D-ornithine 4,5-aminomutase subunit beta